MVKLTIYHVFIFIAVAYILIMSIFPMIYAVFASFTNWHLGLAQMDFTGTANYAQVVADYRLYNSVYVTFLLLALCVPAEMLLGITLAQLMRAKIRFRAIFRTLCLLPLFVAPVAVALMGEVIFYESGGPVNTLLNIFGVNTPPPWRSTLFWAPITTAICDIWLWTPFCFLITLAAMEGIPRELQEASIVDGASSFQIFRSISLPLIGSALSTILLFRVIDTLRMFDIPMILMGGGGPGISTETISIYIYKVAFHNFTLGYAAALSLVMLLMIIVVATVFLGRLRRYYE